MLTIERALTLYMEQLTNDYDADTEKFVRQLRSDDVKEFLESAESIRILCAFQRRKEFNKFFTKLDEYKNELYSFDTAVDFRGKGENEVKEQVDNIFKEEFGDE